MLLIRCHGRCINGKYRRGRQGLKNESLYRTTEPAGGHPPFSSLRPRAHVRVFAGRRAAMDFKTTRGLRTGCDATLQSVHPGRSACLNLHVRLPALSQPGLPRLLRRPQKEGETPLRNPIIGIDSCCARYERSCRHAAKRLRIFVVRCSLPCDPPAGGHSCNGGMIPPFHCAVSDQKADRQVA